MVNAILKNLLVQGNTVVAERFTQHFEKWNLMVRGII